MGDDRLERVGVGPVCRHPLQHPRPPLEVHQPRSELRTGDREEARRDLLRPGGHRAHLQPEAALSCGRGLPWSRPPRPQQHRPREDASEPPNLVRSSTGKLPFV